MTEARTALSKEDKALLIRAAWEALLAPAWLKNDLIDLGKLVFAKVPLREVDEELFARLLPHLTTVAESLGQHLLRPPTQEAAPPAPSPAAAPSQAPAHLLRPQAAPPSPALPPGRPTSTEPPAAAAPPPTNEEKTDG